MSLADSTIEQVTCPICMELPEKEVYQCRNGHPICHQCCVSLAACPQCRVPYEKEKIRNRVAEGLLDAMEMLCPFQKQGCSLKIRRPGLDNHRQICTFRPFNLCSLLIDGSDCKFSSSQPSQIYQHIVDDHRRMKIFPTSQIQINVNDIFSSQIGNHGLHCDFIFPWQTPHPRSCFLNFFLLCLTTSRETEATGERSLFCLNLSNNPQISNRFVVDVQIEIPDTNLMWSWRGSPTHYLETESMLQNPPLKIPLGYTKLALKESGLVGAVIGTIKASVYWL